MTVLALAGLVQADVGVGAVGRAWAWASPEFTAATWTVQLAAAQAVPDEATRLRAVIHDSDEESATPHARALLVAVASVLCGATGD